MTTRKRNNTILGGLILLFCVITLGLFKNAAFLDDPANDHGLESVFVQVSGDVACPGVYGFSKCPDLPTLVQRAGGLLGASEKEMTGNIPAIASGKRIHIQTSKDDLLAVEENMSAFYKMTFGIPLSLNDETLEGLQSIPGIGHKIAGAIIAERNRRHGFQYLDDLLSVPGVGPKLYNKMRPFLIL